MKENFWTTLKVLTAIGASLVIYNYFNGKFSSNLNQSALINSLTALNDILTKSVNDNKTGEYARKEFESFSEKVSSGEIAPEEFQDVAAAILNIRLEEGAKLDTELKKIILDMEFARKESELNKMSGEVLDEKYESIALKIKELALFQEENIKNLSLTDQWSKLTPTTEPQTSQDNYEVNVIISYEPVEPITESSISSPERNESNIIIIDRAPRVAPLIKITDKLDVIVDSAMVRHLDSKRVKHLKKSLERLQHAKTLKRIDLNEKDKSAQDDSPTD